MEPETNDHNSSNDVMSMDQIQKRQKRYEEELKGAEREIQEVLNRITALVRSHEARGGVSADEEYKYQTQLSNIVRDELLPAKKSKAEKEKVQCRNCWL